MKRSLKTFFSFLFLILNLVEMKTLAQVIKEETEALIIETFVEEVNFTFSKFGLSDKIKKKTEGIVKQKFFGDFIYLYTISANDKIIAFGFLDNVYGKSMPITFFVLIDINGNIISTNIIKYREAYGGAVSNKAWIEQFTGKNIEANFKVGWDISSISGATISVNSVTKGIKKILLLYEEIKDEL